ncbi:phosphate ABC transporter permease PstA [Mariniblastus sp.]|nr:phosphate ABC transporter permease PstA [Mariniblastus sp.]
MSEKVLPIRRCVSEFVATSIFWAIAMVVSGLFLWLVADVVINGIGGLSFEFLTSAPSRFGTEGGILPMICSTLLILLIAVVVAVPVSIAAALYLSEFSRGSWLSVMIERGLIILAAVPSVVFGLFGFALFSDLLGMGYSILSGGLTLACMILPIMIRALQAGLESVPDDYRHAAAALAMSKTRTLRSILLPAAAPGLIVGLVLGIGRVLAETAALLFTSGSVDRMPESVFDSGRSLSIHIYELAMNVAGGEPNAYSTALVLLVLLLIINSIAITISDRLLKRKVKIV